jgi:cell division protein DivIC
VSLRRIILSLYLAIFASLSVAAGLYFVDTQEQYHQLKLAETRNRRQLEKAEKDLEDQKRVLERLRTDPAYVERVIRSKLGYAKSDEMIFILPNR